MTRNTKSFPRDLARKIAMVVLSIISIASAAVQGSQTVTGNQPVQPNPARSIQGREADSERIRIGPGDLLTINVFDVPELNQVIRISEKGDGVLILLGPVHLGSMTTEEAQTLIENRLLKGHYVLDPHVSILIQEYGTQGVSVLGEVKNPGTYPVLGARTLLDVIARAGGTTPLAARQATIKRRTGEHEILQASLANDPGELLAGNVLLQPGDTVFVPKAGIVYVLGNVGRPGGFVMQNDGRITLLQAIALALGVNRTAAQSRIRILHKTSSGFDEASINLKRIVQGKAPDLALKPEDIVYVPSSTAKSVMLSVTTWAQTAANSASIYTIAP
jgi:polysaccharide export outer membrane protein